MSRRVAGLVVLIVALTLVPTALARTGRPVLGHRHAFPHGRGFGVVKPRAIDLGGDPTGMVSHLRWQHWGRRRAMGFGRGWCAGRSVASGHPCPASLHLYDLTRCHGRRAYRMMVFYFKPGPRRHWVAGAKINACSGQFVF